MSKFELYDIDNCYVCGEYMGPFKNEITVPTGYSENTIKQIIETYLDSTVPQAICENGGICQNCFIKFNEYDELTLKAQIILSELNEMLRSRDNYVKVKIEEDLDIKTLPPIEYAEYDANVADVPEYALAQEIEYEIQEVDEKDVLSAQKSFKKLPARLGEKKRSGYVKKDKDAGFIITMIDNVKHYTCEFCQKHFLSRARLRSHRQIHNTVRNFMCQECGSSFKTLNCLKNHSRLHSNIFYYCDLCDSRFKGKHELKCHMEAKHLMLKEHICQICGKAFSRDKTLRQHLIYHLNERNIVCEICGFKTINRPKMTRHMKTHTGQRDYECSICKKRFLYSYNVTAHIKHVHFHEKRPQTAEEKLVCNICNKRFQKIWRVKEHMQVVHNIHEETIETTEIMHVAIDQ